MKGVSIQSWNGTHYISLAELLLVIGVLVLRLKWRLRVDEVAIEPGAEAINGLPCDATLNVFELLQLITPRVQIIDGECSAYDAADQLVVILRAVDGSSWDVETNDSKIIQSIANMYPDAVPLPT